MTDYVLVHGAWGGAWCYERLARELVTAGHRVVAVDLPGLGADAANFHPGITLSDHVAHVIAAADSAGFERFVLVGHSYGGMVVTGVAARIGSRIDSLVYVDAFLPADGQSLWDLTGEWEHAHYIDSQKHQPGAVAPLPGFAHPGLTPHPLLTLLEAVSLGGEEAQVRRRIYVFASGWSPTPFARFAEAVRADRPGNTTRPRRGISSWPISPSNFSASCWVRGRPSPAYFRAGRSAPSRWSASRSRSSGS